MNVPLRRTPTQTASRHSDSLPVQELLSFGLLMTLSATSNRTQKADRNTALCFTACLRTAVLRESCRGRSARRRFALRGSPATLPQSRICKDLPEILPPSRIKWNDCAVAKTACRIPNTRAMRSPWPTGTSFCFSLSLSSSFYLLFTFLFIIFDLAPVNVLGLFDHCAGGSGGAYSLISCILFFAMASNGVDAV